MTALPRTDWSTYAKSCTNDEARIIGDIMRLYNNGKPFDLDPTFSTGRFWRGLPEPAFKFDLAPQRADVAQANAAALPLPAASVSSIMFDPPFIAKDTKRTNARLGKIETRFGGYKTIAELWSFYDNALIEFYRLLKPEGLLAFKCQDVVNSGKRHWSHIHIVNFAREVGFVLKDIFVLYRDQVLWSPNMRHQKNSRANHSYFLVFQKD